MVSGFQGEKDQRMVLLAKNDNWSVVQHTVRKAEGIRQSSFVTHQSVPDIFILSTYSNWTPVHIFGFSSLAPALIQLFKSRACRATIHFILHIYCDSYAMAQFCVVLSSPNYLGTAAISQENLPP